MGKNSFSFIRAACSVHCAYTKMDCISITNALARFFLCVCMSWWCVFFAQINHEYRYHLVVFLLLLLFLASNKKSPVNKEQTNQVQRFSLSKWTAHNSPRFMAAKTDSTTLPLALCVCLSLFFTLTTIKFILVVDKRRNHTLGFFSTFDHIANYTEAAIYSFFPFSRCARMCVHQTKRFASLIVVLF